MFEVGGIVHARGQHHHHRVSRCTRTSKCVEETGWIFINGLHSVGVEQRARMLGHGPAVLNDVTHPRGNPHIVFEYSEIARLISNEIDARNRDSGTVAGLNPTGSTNEIRT